MAISALLPPLTWLSGSISTVLQCPLLISTVCLWILAIVVVIPFVRFWIDPHGLRKYPSPSIAGYTSWWLVFRSLRNERWVKVGEAHEKYGSVVRIGPKHLSFTSPAALREIYGHSATPVKDAFYSNQAGNTPNMADAVDKSVHSMKRRALANVFSPKEVLRMEPQIANLVQKLLRDIEIKAGGEFVSSGDRQQVIGGSFDIRPWFNFFSYDVITTIVWSSPYGFLDKGNDLCIAEGWSKLVPAMSTFHDNASFHVAMAQLPKWVYGIIKMIPFHGVRCGRQFAGMVRHLVKQRMTLPEEQVIENPDLFSAIPTKPTTKRPVPMSEEEVIAECTVMLNAGHDTTQTSLTNVLHLLATHPETQEKLYHELCTNLPNASRESAVQPYKELERIPYLRACIDESMRIHTPTRFGLPRVTTKEDTVIAGQVVPSGITVSVPIHEVHMDESIIPLADKFIPERWILSSQQDSINNGALAEEDVKDEHMENTAYRNVRSPELLRNLKEYVNPFSLGSRACIGRNIAYVEMSICLAAIILRYDWQLNWEKHPDGKLKFIERFPSNPKELWVKPTLRPK